MIRIFFTNIRSDAALVGQIFRNISYRSSLKSDSLKSVLAAVLKQEDQKSNKHYFLQR